MKLILLILRPKLLLLLVLAIAIAGVWWFKMGPGHIPAGYQEAKNFINPPKQGQVTCEALSPGCGYCPGKIINGKCYVLKDAPGYNQ